MSLRFFLFSVLRFQHDSRSDRMSGSTPNWIDLDSFLFCLFSYVQSDDWFTLTFFCRISLYWLFILTHSLSFFFFLYHVLICNHNEFLYIICVEFCRDILSLLWTQHQTLFFLSFVLFLYALSLFSTQKKKNRIFDIFSLPHSTHDILRHQERADRPLKDVR